VTVAGSRRAPDLVVVVLSPEGRKKQVHEKLKAYVKCGVKLVWVVDPEVHRDGIWWIHAGRGTRRQ
jgi:Uma2 family endonuclease